MECVDYMTLVVDYMDKILRLVELLAEESQKWALNINTKNTKVMSVLKMNEPCQQAFIKGMRWI